MAKRRTLKQRADTAGYKNGGCWMLMAGFGQGFLAGYRAAQRDAKKAKVRRGK